MDVDVESPMRTGDTARELEKRLLVHSDEVHTETGKHAKCLETWSHFSRRRKLPEGDLRSEEAKQVLQAAVRRMAGVTRGASVRLPWPPT